MILPIFYLLFLWVAALTHGVPLRGKPESGSPFHDCGLHFTRDQIIAAEQSLTHLRPRSIYNHDINDTPLKFNVYWHIISANMTEEGGWVEDTVISQQMKDLDDHFGAARIVWNHVNTTRVINKDWFLNVLALNPQEMAMKETLRRGGSADLNIYTTSNLGTYDNGSTSSAYSFFPVHYAGHPWLDGVVISPTLLPGPIYKKTLTHEVGHWLGLYHTFEGGCDGPGDHVDDTPAEVSPTWDCPIGRDSCPGGGLDPIYNIMDYGNNECRREFTKGQIQRIREQVRLYRSN